MSRRNTQASPFEFFLEQLVELAKVLPLWITLPVAILLYFIVPSPELNTAQLQEQTSMAGWLVKFFLLIIAKYAIPVALIIGAVIKVILQIKSYFLFGSISQQGAAEVIAKLSWQDFEFLLSEWFKKQGYTTDLTGGGGADGGVDIKLYKNGELYLVQCKHYKAYKVPVMVVRELYGVMTAQKAVGGFVVTSGRFTSEAFSFAKNINIELIDRRKLVEVLNAVGVPPTSVSNTTEKQCPKCGSALAEKSGKYGAFLGCSKYPECDYTQSV